MTPNEAASHIMNHIIENANQFQVEYKWDDDQTNEFINIFVATLFDQEKKMSEEQTH